MARKITRNEYKKSIIEVLDLFETEVQPLGARGRQERIEKARSDFWFFFEHYLPHYCGEESPEFHKEIIEMLESEATRMCLGAPRGFSKSTLVSFVYVIWCVLRERNKFIVLVSATDDLAEDLSDFIRLEFTDNRRILEDFGQLMFGIGEAGDFTVNKTRILARGRNTAVRGFRNRQYRPDLIILDDIEKDSEATSPMVVKKTLEGISRGLIPSLTPKGKFILVGTILRKRSVMGTILLSEEEPWSLWERKIYRAIIPDGKGNEVSLWEERFSLSFLHEQLKIMGRSSFNAEYQNMPSDEDSALFKESYIIDKDMRNKANALPMVMFIDPSTDGVKQNDYKACVLVAKDDEGYHIVDGSMVQGSDNKFFKEVLDIYKKYSRQILSVGVEANGFQMYFMKELDRFAKELGIHLPLYSMKNTLKKEYRIQQMVGLFEAGKITFNTEFRKSPTGKILIEQLLFFPSSAVHDDAPDALASAIKLLDGKTNKISSGFTLLPKVKRNPFGGFRKRW